VPNLANLEVKCVPSSTRGRVAGLIPAGRLFRAWFSEILLHRPLCVDAFSAPDAVGPGEIDSGCLHPQLGDLLPLCLEEREVGEERGNFVAARRRGELQEQTSLVAAPLVEANRGVDAPERELSNAQTAGS
jgi:hypothetical protein